MRIGFIGLGNMGSLMLPHLLKAGYRLTIYDISQDALAPFEGKGASIVGNPRAVAEASDTILTSLPTPSVVEEVYLGANGLLEGSTAGQVYVDLSSVNPALPRMLAVRFAEKGAKILDAPVSGGTIGARDATLAIMVGGEGDTLSRVEPVLKCLGSRVFHCGPVGSGSTMKLLNQILFGINTMAVAEMAAVVRRSGVDVGLLKQIITSSSGSSQAFKVRFDKAIHHDFTPGFGVDLVCKDLRLAQEMARELGLDLPVVSKVLSIYERCSESGLGMEDVISAVLLVEEPSRGKAADG